MNLAKISHGVFSSSEHELLKVSYWDQSMSSLSAMRCQQFHLNDNSFTTWIFLTKLQRNVLPMTLYKKYKEYVSGALPVLSISGVPFARHSVILSLLTLL